MDRPPPLSFDRPLLTDAGLETDMIFNRGIDLPLFASILLLRSATGRDALQEYFGGFVRLAKRLRCGVILESATWRASPDWAGPLGLSGAELDRLNDAAVRMLRELRGENPSVDLIASGCIGPRGDGYDPGRIMSVAEADDYHQHQAGILVSAGADMLSALTMTNIPEATGIVRAAQRLGAPVAISFTVEIDGRLPTGETLSDAVMGVDEATGGYPAHYMINCAHPTHFADVLDPEAAWLSRVRGVRANASRCSHAELDAMTELDIGDSAELAVHYRTLRNRFPGITILGGCCGTDLRHVTAIAEACFADT